MKQWKKWGRFALAVALGASAATAFGAPQCTKRVTLGSWNIQWLGNPAAGKRAPQDPADLASYIATAGVDVLALSEISRTHTTGGSATPRNHSLDAAFEQLNANGSASWRYMLFPKREGARAPEDQWVGVAWNTGAVKLTGGPWKLPVQIDEAKENAIRAKFPDPGEDTVIFSRWPHAVKFSAGSGATDWVLVPVHLKSNTDGPATREAREYEVQLLLAGLDAIRDQHADKDIIVLGDTNMLATDEPAGQLMRGAGYRDCNGKDLGTHLSFKQDERGAPFDRIFVLPARAATAATCAAPNNGSKSTDFKVVRPAQWQPGTTNVQFRKLLSDHLLVRTTLCVAADDD